MEQLNNINMNWHNQTVPAKNSSVIKNIKGERYLYDTNTMALYKLESDEVINTKSFGHKMIPFAVGHYQEMRHKMLVFQATYACNLKCKYCFVMHHYADQENSLSLGECIDAINKYQVPYDEKTGQINGFNYGFFGGEPLMNWQLIYELTEWTATKAKELSEKYNKNIPYSLHITTNATLITEEIAEYCAKHGFSFIVSLDGEKEVHDENRPYANDGSGTFEDTIRGLKFLADAYKKAGRHNPITLRATFDKNGTNILDSVKFLNKLMFEGLASHVSVEPSSLGESCATKDSIFEDLKEKEIRAMFQNQYYETADWFLSELNNNKRPSFHHFEMNIQRIYDRQPAFTECGAGKGYLSIGPKGNICACHREHQTAMGNIYNGGIDRVKQAMWLDNRFYNRSTCPTCWRRHICGGGCRCNSLLVNNPINQPSKVECVFKDMQLKAVFYLLGKMTDDQKRLYSRINKPQLIKRPQPVNKLKKKSCDCNGNCSLDKKKEACKDTCQAQCQNECQYKGETENSKRINPASSCGNSCQWSQQTKK